MIEKGYVATPVDRKNAHIEIVQDYFQAALLVVYAVDEVCDGGMILENREAACQLISGIINRDGHPGQQACGFILIDDIHVRLVRDGIAVSFQEAGGHAGNTGEDVTAVFLFDIIFFQAHECLGSQVHGLHLSAEVHCKGAHTELIEDYQGLIAAYDVYFFLIWAHLIFPIKLRRN